MTAPTIWRGHNANTGEPEELSDRQMWDLYRAEFSWQELAPWEQQDARTQQAFLAFLESTSDPEDEVNIELLELSERQMWDLYRAEFSWQELAPWEQQDARTQQAFLAFLESTSDPEDEVNIEFLESTSDPEDDANTELQEKYRRVALHENMNLLQLLTECGLDNAKLLALAVIERVHAITTEDAEVGPATIADMKTMGEMAKLLRQNRKEPD